MVFALGGLMRGVLAGCALALTGTCAHAADVAGVRIPDTVRVAGQELVLNGAGVRYRALFKVYVAALYLPERKSSAAQVLAASGPKRFSMTMLRDITAQQLIDGLMNGVRDNHTAAEVEKFRPRMEAFAKVMSSVGHARTGSAMTIDFIPGAGTQPGIDGKPQGTPIPGEDFYRALLRIWLGDTVDTLQKELLGQG